MSSLCRTNVKNLKQESSLKDDDLEIVAFETEVHEIEELETELEKYKHLIERIKHILKGKDDVRVEIQNILKPPNLKRNVEIID